MKEIRVAVVGVGNCSSALIQGIHWYSNGASVEFNSVGLAHPELGENECLDRAIAITSMLLGAARFIGPSKQYANRANSVSGGMLAMAMEIAGTNSTKDYHIDDRVILTNH